MSRIVIAGFSGIGKSTLARKYKNVIDLDASEFVYDDTGLENLNIEQRKGLKRKSNPNWPKNYIDAIKKEVENYDIVLVWERPDILMEYKRNNIDFSLCYPTKESLNIYANRYLIRGNSKEYVNMKINQYDERLKVYYSLDVDKIILFGNETLEDYLLKNNYSLENI